MADTWEDATDTHGPRIAPLQDGSMRFWFRFAPVIADGLKIAQASSTVVVSFRRLPACASFLFAKG